jgi:hypothetical protein
MRTTMAKLAAELLTPAWQSCRTVALALIAGVARKTGFERLEHRVEALPFRAQALIVG